MSTFRGELKRTGLVGFAARFLVAEVGVAQAVGWEEDK